jgi:hypothetical protein
MSWPLRLRAMSFAITLGVTLLESIMAAVPIGLALWYFEVARTSTIFALLAVLIATLSLSISIYSHILPPPVRRAARIGDGS